MGWVRAALVALVVEMVSVAGPAAVPLMLTGLVEPKLRVGGYRKPAGAEVIAAVSTTLPVNPPVGVRVIVEVFPAVAPGATESAVPLIVKLGGIGVVIVIEVVPEAVL